MVFSSTIFLFIFLPVVLLGYYGLFRSITARNYLLLAVSLGFYAWGEPLYVFLMVISILGNFCFGLLIDRTETVGKRRGWLVLTVCFNLGILFYFKYLNFAVDNINALFGLQLYAKPQVLPIGISFFTFQAMSYVFDVYRKTAKVQRNILYLALYISFFPQLVAGPIVRYNSIEEQIVCRTVTADKFQQGVFRFIQGFGKKVILSNMMSITAERVFDLAVGGELSVAMAWLGSVAYTFQIFFDFSGYSDMAIGLGRMFGFEFEENFNYPYMTKSISEFWNRWHISLGHWFRDYVYFPLGGSRAGKWKTVRNLFVVWMLTGIWHGAAWQFVIWGLGYGLLIALEKVTSIPKRLESQWAAGLYRVFTLLVVNGFWVLFGARNIHSALYQLRVMFGLQSAALTDALTVFTLSEYWPYFLLALFFSTPAMSALTKRIPRGTLYGVGQAAVYLTVLLIAVSYLAMGVHNPFIYFNF